ncbi:MAG: diphosphate--fructose-6-phosphate 1-phosphotransferase [Thermomicrobiales bacterium]|nr:diphosphate--fructose-6-phosphate 1-phosphotransferase [Thermomicrobiales bacterium]
MGGRTIPAGTLLVAQSGGPTVVMNASLVGIIAAAQQSETYSTILGAVCGIEGVLNDAFVDLSRMSAEQLDRLRLTPSAALGTSRHRPTDAEIPAILDRFAELSVTAFLPIGGNDTAETALRLHAAAAKRGQALQVVTIPKTIDNDLPETDHCPGYGSVARYTALSVRDAAFDTRAMRQIYPVKIIEVMGRNAGWLAASAGLAFGDLPQPILCLPERPIDGIDTLTTMIATTIERDGYAVLVTPETMRWADGTPVGGTTPEWTDAFGHAYYRGVGSTLSRELSSRLGIQARYDKPGTIARMAMASASSTDLDEAEQVGREAVQHAIGGASGVMVTICRTSTHPYTVDYGVAPLDRIATIERRMPDSMIDPTGHNVTDEFRAWARPLLGDPLPEYEVLI